jgi:phage/plasmid-like protein (TIGR03299 family)
MNKTIITPESYNNFIQEKGLDFNVATATTPVAPEILDINPDAKSGQYQIYRTDTGKIFHSGMSDQYHPIQNSDALSFIKDLAETSNQPIHFVNGGTWKDGAQVFAQIQLGQASVGRNNGDIISQNVTFMNSHNGTYSMKVLLTPLRLFCANQIATVNRAMAKGGKEISFKIRHSETAMIKMDELRAELKIIDGEFFNSVEEYNKLAGIKTSDEYVEAILNDIFKTDEPREGRAKTNFDLRVADATARYNHADGGRIEKNTAWNLYNAVQGSIQHAPTRLLQANAKIDGANDIKALMAGEDAVAAFNNLDRTESILAGGIARESSKALDSVMRIASSQTLV